MSTGQGYTTGEVLAVAVMPAVLSRVSTRVVVECDVDCSDKTKGEDAFQQGARIVRSFDKPLSSSPDDLESISGQPPKKYHVLARRSLRSECDLALAVPRAESTQSVARARKSNAQVGTGSRKQRKPEKKFSQIGKRKET